MHLRFAVTVLPDLKADGMGLRCTFAYCWKLACVLVCNTNHAGCRDSNWDIIHRMEIHNPLQQKTINCIRAIRAAMLLGNCNWSKALRAWTHYASCYSNGAIRPYPIMSCIQAALVHKVSNTPHHMCRPIATVVFSQGSTGSVVTSLWRL